MKNTIKWYHVSLDFKKQNSEEQVPFTTAVVNNLAVDPDVPVAGSPVNPALYTQQIADVAADLALRKTNTAKTLTLDEHTKVNLLQNSTESIAQLRLYKMEFIW
jgi:hypothetical protein